jgi:iron complex transport system permease protein
VPHLARKLAGASLQKSLPVSVLLGAVVVTLADLVGRLVIAPSQLPVGIVMALVGAPFYFYLLLRRASHAEI